MQAKSAKGKGFMAFGVYASAPDAAPTVPAVRMYKFQAKVQSGNGEYKVGVFSKPQ